MLVPGTHLKGRYEIIELIYQGGMGAVYRASDQQDRRTVALKETHVADRTLRQALEREARVLASLSHPALPRVIDHFTEGTGQFLVMEFIEGDDLQQLLARPNSWLRLREAVPAVLRWGDQLLDVLEYLHTRPMPIVHGDIKPRNLKHRAQGEIVLLDFGLSTGGLSLSQPPDGENQSTTLPPREAGARGFTHFYAPVEQIRGAELDPRSDLYSLAATLYHLLTGVRPADAMDRVMAYMDSEPDPLLPANEVMSQLPSGLAGVLAKALALRPNDRFASAAAMRAALQSTRAAARAPSQNGSPALPPRPAAYTTARAEPMYTLALDSPARALVFDAKNAVLAIGGEDGAVTLWSLQHNTVLGTMNGHDGGIRSLSFTPDGSTLVTGGDDRTVRLWDVTAGRERERLPVGRMPVESTLISPDGRLIAAGGWGSAVLLWEMGASGPQPLESLPAIYLHSLAFSPDGRFLVAGGFEGSVVRWALPAGTALAPLNAHDASVLNVAYSPDGAHIASSGSSKVVLWRVRSERPLPTPQLHTSSVRSLAFSPNSALLATASEDRTVRLWRVDNATPLAPVFEHPSGVVAVCFSPDGQWVVSSAHDGKLRLWRTPPLT